MRILQLSNNGFNRIKANHTELKVTDFDDSLKSLVPGEWCKIEFSKTKEAWVAYINPLLDEKLSCGYLVTEFSESFDIESFIKFKLVSAFEKRKVFKGYENFSRYFYGGSDGLNGLIIDRFKDKAIIQINTAGLDIFRNHIKSVTENYISGKAYFLDNPKYREKEFLPSYENEEIPDISVEENGIKFLMRSEIIQKVGFYFDHRENRKFLKQHLQDYNREFKTGVDLFSYVGAWGFCALDAGVESMTFIDQGDFEKEFQTNLEINNIDRERVLFQRSDVFKKMDELIEKKSSFDLVLCDPPAFAKSLSQKNSALEGYTRLHRKAFKILAPQGVVAFSSCTHYVDHVEFQKNILEAAAKEGRKLNLLYSGIQGWDHPIKSLNEKSNYIKCFIYKLEN